MVRAQGVSIQHPWAVRATGVLQSQHGAAWGSGSPGSVWEMAAMASLVGTEHTWNGREKRLMVFLSVGEGVGQAVAPRNVIVPLWEFRHSSSSYLCLEGGLPARSIPAVPRPYDSHLVPLILLMLSSHLFAQPSSPSIFLFTMVAENRLWFSRSLSSCGIRQGGIGCCI